jgi:hypothetical protein
MAVMVLAGCAPAQPADPFDLPEDQQPLTDATAEAEYEAAIDGIPEPMPDGVDFPATLPADFVPDPEVGYLGKGLAYAHAWLTWLCAWEGEYLDARSDGDADRQSEAEEMITGWPDMEYYQTLVDDPTGAWPEMVSQPMALGDPSGVRSEHTSLCQYYPTAPAGE